MEQTQKKIWLIFHNGNKMDKQQYFQQMLQLLDIHMEEEEGRRRHRLYILSRKKKKKTSTWIKDLMENGESIKLLEISQDNS